MPISFENLPSLLLELESSHFNSYMFESYWSKTSYIRTDGHIEIRVHEKSWDGPDKSGAPRIDEIRLKDKAVIEHIWDNQFVKIQGEKGMAELIDFKNNRLLNNSEYRWAKHVYFKQFDPTSPRSSEFICTWFSEIYKYSVGHDLHINPDFNEIKAFIALPHETQIQLQLKDENVFQWAIKKENAYLKISVQPFSTITYELIDKNFPGMAYIHVDFRNECRGHFNHCLFPLKEEKEYDLWLKKWMNRFKNDVSLHQ